MQILMQGHTRTTVKDLNSVAIEAQHTNVVFSFESTHHQNPNQATDYLQKTNQQKVSIQNKDLMKEKKIHLIHLYK